MTEPRTARTRRPYTLRRRQARVDETKERITAAAFDLHATIGPSRTTISAIAARAGVQRHTVYQHFPDLDALYEACTEHGLRTTGVPDPAGWDDIADPRARLGRGLDALFGWFRANERMLSAILGDAMAAEPPPVPPAPDLFDRHMTMLFEILNDGWESSAATRPVLGAVIAHAMAFETWRSLTRAGLSDTQARDLLVDLASRVASGTL